MNDFLYGANCLQFMYVVKWRRQRFFYDLNHGKNQGNKDTGFLGVERASGESRWEMKEVGHIGVAW